MAVHKKRIYPILVFCLAVLLMSCGKEELYPRSFVGWVENPVNELRVHKKVNPYEFTIQYKPLDYIIAMEERKETLESAQVNERKEALGEEMDYFNFRISMTDTKKNVLLETAADESQYYQLIDYFSYGAQKDFYLLNGPDTMKCLLYNFVRSYDLSPHLDFALGFEKAKGQDRLFVFDDQVLNVGEIRTRIKEENINRVPQLKTN